LRGLGERDEFAHEDGEGGRFCRFTGSEESLIKRFEWREATRAAM
jgi:hypothetical protein